MNIFEANVMDVEKLYSFIGQQASAGIGLGEVDEEENISRGKRWLSKQRQQLKKHICSGNLAKLVIQEDRQWDQLVLIAAIADLISSLTLGVSPIAVAALLVKEGLSNFCDENRED